MSLGKMHLHAHRIWLVLALLASILVVTPQAYAQSRDEELQQMKDKVQQLEQQLQELKAQITKVQQTSTTAQPAPTTTSEPSANIAIRANEEAQETPAAPAETAEGKNKIDIYGHVMLDSGYEFGQSNPDWFDVMRPTQLSSSKGEFAPDGKVYFGVRQTRFGVKTSTPTGIGALKTIFE